jgi:hypothetical protein
MSGSVTPEQARQAQLKYKYNLTQECYLSILREQNFACKICKTIKATGPSRSWLVVDHDHSNNKVRSLLCNNCNTGLGLFQDSHELILKALNYLNSF